VVPPPLSPDVSVMISAEVPVTVTDTEVVEASRKALKKVIADHFNGDRTIVSDAFYGNPWPSVCEYAERNDIDLIIVATHGRTGLSHAVIGSTAERIVQHAPCPVLTVKNPQREFLVE
jgi:nucleotide-binding universal stress UspA family protein